MAAATLSLVLIALACLAFVIGRLTKIPLPFLQIAIGAIAALPPFRLHLVLDPELFLLLFIPPLLFADGWTMPQRELLALRWPVFGHAVGLVLLTVIAGGYFLHWLIPVLPLSVAFATAAVVSPTDAVAVSSFTRTVSIPQRMRHLLESEALLNDASGLFAMRTAVAATLGGGLSLLHAGVDFALAAAGLAIGAAVTLIYRVVHHRLLLSAQDATVQTVLTGLLPFAAYAAAEALGASGILAAVGAGMAASRIGLLEPAHFSARLQTTATWGVVAFCLNGVIFVLLGLQLPGIIGAGPNGINLLTDPTRLRILGEIGALTALLIALRLLWVLASIGISRIGRSNPAPARLPTWRVVLATSLAGVRGAVTLAGVLSLPLLLPTGAAFPGRDLAITLATGTILTTMLIAAAALPLLLRQPRANPLAPDPVAQDPERHLMRTAAAQAALHALTAEPASTPRAALHETYAARLADLSGLTQADDQIQTQTWRRLHRTALHAERAAIQRLRLAAQISDDQARQAFSELDLLEAALTQRPLRLSASASSPGPSSS